jgi:hypothetical protein
MAGGDQAASAGMPISDFTFGLIEVAANIGLLNIEFIEALFSSLRVS